MCGFIRQVTRFSLVVLACTALFLALLALGLLFAPRLLLLAAYYGGIALCILACLGIAASLLRAAFATHKKRANLE